MAENSFREVIKEVVIKLRLPIAVYIDATKYCSQLKESRTHSFSTEVLEVASTYLATKVNEEYRRIRGSFTHFTYRYSQRCPLRTQATRRHSCCPELGLYRL
eukprot:TRINITY_DN9182_c0_g6_i1.p3 TRINITY_DN9182_c0_g6~~TRINITY_DN9182_c0_g6_i1.p3  ORF type:complete len:102 (+),score=1.83 TRINITY_DN9182_c0_g6_i1:29-334(+)